MRGKLNKKKCGHNGKMNKKKEIYGQRKMKNGKKKKMQGGFTGLSKKKKKDLV